MLLITRLLKNLRTRKRVRTWPFLNKFRLNLSNLRRKRKFLKKRIGKIKKELHQVKNHTKMNSKKFQEGTTMNSTFIFSHKEASMTPMVCTSMQRDLIRMADIMMKMALTLIRTESLINYYNKNLRKEGGTTKKMTSLLSSLRRRSRKMTIMMRFKKSIITNSK